MRSEGARGARDDASDVGRGVAFVTGASSGLGRGMSVRLARAGYGVGLAARREDALREVAAEIEREGGRAAVCPCDVAEREQVREAVAVARERLGPIDLLVCNAGISETTEIGTFDAADVERVLRVNFLGAVYAVDAVLDGMRARGAGHLVAVGSLAGYGGLPRTAAYSASKGALHNFFESLRLDLSGGGVDVTVITPGYVDTPMTADQDHARPFLVDLDDAADRMTRAILRRRPLLSFPIPLAPLVWVGQIFPAWLYDRIAARQRQPVADRG